MKFEKSKTIHIVFHHEKVQIKAQYWWVSNMCHHIKNKNRW